MRTPKEISESILSEGKGILVADEYVDKLLPSAPEDPTREPCTSAAYVNVAIAAPQLDQYVSALLLTEDGFKKSEQIRIARRDSMGIDPLQFGVRMDAGRTRAAAKGSGPRALYDVHQHLSDLRAAGASFAEWRANLDPRSVSRGETHIDAGALAQGAAVSQAEEILPLVTVAMPDLASHSGAVSQAVTANALGQLFAELMRFEVDPSSLLLRINMVIPGDASRHQATPEEVARATLRVIAETVPAEIAGIAFLSGGQTITQACANLSAIKARTRTESRPCRFTFAFTRAVIAPSIASWQCEENNVPEAQRELITACQAASQAVSSPPAGDSASA